MAASSSLSRFSKLATDPLRSFRFLAEFRESPDGQPFDAKLHNFSGGFTQVSGLAINTQAIGYREGGFNTTLHQMPGMTTFSPITLQRGTIFGKDEAITWMRGLFGAASGDGLPIATGKTFRCNVDIWVMDHPLPSHIGPNDTITEASKKMKFTIHNAWITALNYSDLNATDNQLLFETMQLVHEGISVSFVNGPAA